MNDIRRTILWVIFSFSLVLLWDQWKIYNGQAATFFPSMTQQAGTTGQPTAQTNSTNGRTQSPSATQSLLNEDASALAQAASAKPETLYEVSTDVLKLKFSSRGGRLVYAELLGYKDVLNPEQNVVLLDDRKGYVYIAQTGLSGGNFPNHTSDTRLLDGPKVLESGQDDLVLRFESVLGGVRLLRTWTFTRASYVVQVDTEVVNESNQNVSPELYERIFRDGNKPEGESSFYFTFTGPALYTPEGKYQKIDFDDIQDNSASFERNSAAGYIAMVQHYFVSAWILPDGLERQNIVSAEGDNEYAVGMLAPLGEIGPGQSKQVKSTFFVGPQLEKTLGEVYPGLELVKDYGWLTILAKPLYWLLDKIHSVLSNWGWSIMALVFLLKLALYGLNAKAYTSMAKMKAVNPKITEMRERLKDNPKQMQQEMMRIYKEEKVNPLGGCLPMVVQIPVFIALYWVLLSSVEMRDAPWILWIHDLSIPDPYYILPIIMTATTVLQTWLNPRPADPTQAKLMWFMPLAFSVMFFLFPAGLVLYWITNNVLTIAQQWMINKRMGVL